MSFVHNRGCVVLDDLIVRSPLTLVKAEAELSFLGWRSECIVVQNGAPSEELVRVGEMGELSAVAGTCKLSLRVWPLTVAGVDGLATSELDASPPSSAVVTMMGSGVLALIDAR